MISALVVPAARRRLDRFMSAVDSARVHPSIEKRIESLYAPVWPLSLTDEDLRAFVRTLYLATRYFKPRAVVQTGTFVGTSSMAIALALAENGEGRLYTIDPEPPEYFGVGSPVDVARAVAARSGLDGRITFLRGYSTIPLDRGRMELVGAPEWQLREAASREPFDMLVVDGDHTYFGCYLDLLHGTAALAPDGPRVVVAHDCLGIPDVRKAFRRRAGELRGAVTRILPSPCGIGLMQLGS